MVWALPLDLDALVAEVESCCTYSINSGPRAGDAVNKEEPVRLSSPQEFWAYVQQGAGEGKGIREEEQVSESVVRLQGFVRSCEELKEKIKAARGLLDAVENEHLIVSEKTSSLHERCKALLEEQTRFERYVQEIEGPLSYLNEAGRIEAVLKHGTRADSEEFGKVLARVDECIAFVDSQPGLKEFAEYKSRFSQLRLQCLRMIRGLLVGALRATAVSARASLEARATLESIEIRFRAQAGELRKYVGELESRASSSRDARQELFAVHKSYCDLRLDLLRVTALRAPELGLQRNDLVQTLRTACPYLLGLSRSEYRLFYEHFAEIVEPAFGEEDDTDEGYYVDGSAEEDEQDALLSMMIQACSVLGDVVRPLIVQLDDLKTLCEVVRTIEGDVIEGHVEMLGNSGRALHVVLTGVLHDVQERLIFRASQYITEHILNFECVAADLQYPEILEDKDRLANGGLLAGCYPTLDATLQCLIWMYRCVEQQTFEELALEAVGGCATSLSRASARISLKSKVDGDLFFIKHLLVLREQISPFNTAMTSHRLDLDFAPTTKALGDLFSHTMSIFSRRNNALVEFVSHGVPRVRETEVDCKRDLETMLKQACEKLILRTYEQSLAGIIAFLQRASKASSEDVAFEEQDFASPERLQQLLSSYASSVPEFFAHVRQRMHLYLCNPQTEAILFNPIKANVLAALQQLSQCIEANYSQEQAATMLRTVAAIRATL